MKTDFIIIEAFNGKEKRDREAELKREEFHFSVKYQRNLLFLFY